MQRSFFFASSAVCQHGANAGRIDGHRLLAEDVLAGLDRRLEMHRAEMRRRGKNDNIDPGA